jgi:hypothetical protein
MAWRHNSLPHLGHSDLQGQITDASSGRRREEQSPLGQGEEASSENNLTENVEQYHIECQAGRVNNCQQSTPLR